MKTFPFPPFGRVQSPFDNRDYPLSNYMPGRIVQVLQNTVVQEKTWTWPGDVLNQGQTPHCVGFSMAGFGICEPVNTKYSNGDGHRYYYECKKVDGLPANVSGSTIRAAAKVLQKEGAINGYAFAYTVEEMKYWVLNKGPMIIGTVWTSDMSRPNHRNGTVSVTGAVEGGHAYDVIGYTNTNLFKCANSWGKTFGQNGFFYITYSDMEILLRQGGEAIAAVEIEKVKPQPKPVVKPVKKKKRRDDSE